MKNGIVKIIVIVVIVIGLILIASVFWNRQEAVTETQKNEEEIKYLDTKLLSLINYLNNIQLQNYKVTLTKVEAKNNTSGTSSKEEQKNENEKENPKNGTDTSKEETEISKMEKDTIVTKDEEINWDTIEGKLELLYSTWPAIVLDLYNINVSSEDILSFSSTLDDVIINVKKKDKTLSAMYIAKLYSFLPRFLDKNFEDDLKRKTLESKMHIINAYAFAETKNFEKIEEEIEKAEKIFTALVSDAKFINDKRRYNINKSYILIEELKNSISTKDTDIFYVKYKNTMEELNILS